MKDKASLTKQSNQQSTLNEVNQMKYIFIEAKLEIKNPLFILTCILTLYLNTVLPLYFDSIANVNQLLEAIKRPQK